MHNDITALSQRLAQRAESFCRTYLDSGRRAGGYWIVGDAENTPGRSLFVRLAGPDSGQGAAGRWTDAATGEYGDLLDLLARRLGRVSMAETLAEARRFLAEPAPTQAPPMPGQPSLDYRIQSARRLLAMSGPVKGTLAERYLAERGLILQGAEPALRFLPQCYVRVREGQPRQTWPALIAAVTDLQGHITGVQRLYLARDGAGKAPFPDPRRALGRLHGCGVPLGPPPDRTLIVGEGLETMLALRTVLPDASCVAALSAAHLAAYLWPPALRCLIVAADNDDAGRRAACHLADRADRAGVTVRLWIPGTADWNSELLHVGVPELRGRLQAHWSELMDEPSRIPSIQRQSTTTQIVS